MYKHHATTTCTYITLIVYNNVHNNCTHTSRHVPDFFLLATCTCTCTFWDNNAYVRHDQMYITVYVHVNTSHYMYIYRYIHNATCTHINDVYMYINHTTCICTCNELAYVHCTYANSLHYNYITYITLHVHNNIRCIWNGPEFYQLLCVQLSQAIIRK